MCMLCKGRSIGLQNWDARVSVYESQVSLLGNQSICSPVAAVLQIMICAVTHLRWRLHSLQTETLREK